MIAVDAPVVLDVLADGPSAEASVGAIRDALAVGPVVICDVVAAEVCSHGDSAEVMGLMRDMGILFSPVEEKSALRAAEMHRRWRQRQGSAARGRTMPDFLIGAHALLQCDGLITRDAGFFRDYFKGLNVIVPQAD